MQSCRQKSYPGFTPQRAAVLRDLSRREKAKERRFFTGIREEEDSGGSQRSLLLAWSLEEGADFYAPCDQAAGAAYSEGECA